MDAARKWTEEQLEAMERQIKSIYSDANQTITKNWKKYMERGQRELSALYAQLEMEGTEEALKKYQQAVASYTIRNERYKEMVEDTARRIANANQIAINYMNREMPKIYLVNYNQASEFGIKFSLIDEATVRRRILEGDIQLPYKTLDIPKDMRWNTKKLNSSVLQGILTGEPMDKIAKRIKPVVDGDEEAAIRNARTMVTGAENVGRLDSYKELEADGAILQKVWISTSDSRTREAHLKMNGQQVGNEEPFIDGDGNPLMYPGDPNAAPCTVYNCRCSMSAKIMGFIPRNRRGK